MFGCKLILCDIMNEFPIVELRKQDIDSFYRLALISSLTKTGLSSDDEIIYSPDYQEGVYILTAGLILNSYIISKDSLGIIDRYRNIANNIFKQFVINYAVELFDDEY